MDKFYAVYLEEARLPRDVAIDLMRRARESAGGEGELKATLAKNGHYCVLFEAEGHRDAFQVSLRRRSVEHTSKDIDASNVTKPAPKPKQAPKPNPAPVSVGEVLLGIVESLIEELRKKK